MQKARQARPSETLVSMTSVRWLADLCGLPPADDFPSLASALLRDAKVAGAVTAYLGWWIRHPDPLSRFERATRRLPKMPDAALVAELLKMGYDGLLYLREGEIGGHVFFHSRRGSVRIFLLGRPAISRRQPLGHIRDGFFGLRDADP
jgi:hypothetical protein